MQRDRYSERSTTGERYVKNEFLSVRQLARIMLRGSTATTAAETDSEFAWRTNAGSIAGRWRLLQSERGVHQLSRALLLASAALSAASLRHSGIRYATHGTNRDDRLYSTATATPTERDSYVTAAQHPRSAIAAPSAAASSPAAATRGPDDAPTARRLGTVSPVNVQLQVC